MNIHRRPALLEVRVFSYIVLLLGVLASLFALNIFQAKAMTQIYVRTDGNDAECDGSLNIAYPGGSGPLACAVQTIQHGIDLVNPGGVVEVAAGVYLENVIVNKSVTLLGAQHDILPTNISERGGPGSESIVRPPTSVPDRSNLFTVLVDNITINGFMLDGNNPSLTDCTNDSNGICLHVGGGVANGVYSDSILPDDFSHPVNNLTVSYNIIKNVNQHGVGLSSDAGTPTSNNLITKNVIDNMVGGTHAGAPNFYPYGSRRAIWLRKNQYANITGNIITRAQNGIHINQFSLPNPGISKSLSENNISPSSIGIYVLGFFDTSDPFEIVDNTVTGAAFAGIELKTIRSQITILVEGNSISGNSIGVDVNDQTRANLFHNIIDGNITGIQVVNSAVLVSATNNFITNNTTQGILATQAASAGIVGSIANNDFSGNTAGINNTTASLVNASANWWGSPSVPISSNVDFTPWLDSGSDTSLDPGFQGDFSSLSVDDLSPQTGASGRIQEGVNLVSASGVVHVLPGDYPASVNLNRDATVQAMGDISLGGNLAIQQGVFTAPSGNLQISGNFSRSSGVFDPNNGLIIFNGAAPQTIGGAAFNNLTLSNASGASLSAPVQIAGDLSLSNGVLSLGAHQLLLGLSASISGAFDASHMIAPNGSGALCKLVPDSPTFPLLFSFPVGDITATPEFSPAAVQFSSGSFSSAQLCVRLANVKHPADSSSDYLNRYWSLTSSGVSSFAAALTFHYLEADITGAESALLPAQYAAGTWSYGPLSDIDPSNNQFGMSVASFSDFTAKSQAVNTPPSDIALSNQTINENQPSNTAVGTLSTTDPDLPPQSFTYSLVDTPACPGTHNTAFNIAGDQLRSSIIFDHETQNSYTICIRTDDGAGGTLDKPFTISILNVNDAPTQLSLSNNSLNENQPINSIIGALSSVDPDLPPQSFTYSLVDTPTCPGPHNAAFNIAGDQLRSSIIFDYETQDSYTICIRTDDGAGGTLDKPFTISILNVNDAPTQLSLSNNSLNENQPINSIIGALSSVDPDLPPQSFTYSLIDTPTCPGTHNTAFNIVGNQLRSSIIFDYETQNSYAICIRTDDGAGGTLDRPFTISILDINDAPILFASGGLSLDAMVATNNPGILTTELISHLSGEGISDQDAGALEGIAITQVDNANGAWQYSLDGSQWFDLGSPTSASARLLAADATTHIRFTPNPGFYGAIQNAITFRAWDQTSGVNGGLADTTTNGGTTAFSTATETASLTILYQQFIPLALKP